MSFATRHQFHVTDYLVFVSSLIIFLGVGIYQNVVKRGRTTVSEYFIGSRKMAVLPVGISLAVTYQSSITLLGFPAEGYLYGIETTINIIASTLLTIWTVRIMVPLLHPLKLMSVYEYLEMRFQSKVIRRFAVILSMLDTMALVGIAAYGPSLAVDTVAGLPTMGAIFCGLLAATIYTCIGGFRTVIWTDVIQYFIMVAGILAILIKVTIDAGGLSNVWEAAHKGGRLELFNFDPNPTVRQSFWSLCMSSVTWSFYIVINQSSAQRISSTPTTKSALRMFNMANPFLHVLQAVVLFQGIVLYAYYEIKKCDPFKAGHIKNPNLLIPYVVMDIFQSARGMPGLFVAALYSASLSTISSGLSGMSVSLWKDVVSPLLGNVSEFKATLIAKIIVILLGLAGLGTAVLMSIATGNFIQLLFTAVAGFRGTLVALFVLGSFSPRCTAKGALTGTVIAFLLSSWICIGKMFSKSLKQAPWLSPASTDNCFLEHIGSDLVITYNDTGPTIANSTLWMISTVAPQLEGKGINRLYQLSFRYLEPLAFFTSVTVGLAVSYFTGMNKPGDIDPRYLISVTDALLFLLPKKLRERIGSIGAQFMKEEYKASFPDPAESNGEITANTNRKRDGQTMELI